MPVLPRVSRRLRPSHRLAAICLALTPVGAAACSLSTPQAAPKRVVLVGDSIAQETDPYLQQLLGSIPVIDSYFGGTAPCDWLGKDLQTDASSVAVVTFTGNSLTACMSDGGSDHLHGQALVDKYRVDLTALVQQIRATGARVLLVGQPQRGGATAATGNPEVAGINAIYVELANTAGVSFVDAGATVEDANGAFATALPCLAGEAQCGPDGTNVVRNDDGVHLCPGAGAGAGAGACAVYSSGALRFATAIHDALAGI